VSSVDTADQTIMLAVSFGLCVNHLALFENAEPDFS
jgi:hypothetical protein